MSNIYVGAFIRKWLPGFLSPSRRTALIEHDLMSVSCIPYRPFAHWSAMKAGFPTGVKNIGGWGGAFQNSMRGEGLSEYMEGAWELKTVLKNTCKGVHFLVKLSTISQLACKFTKNELLHIHIFQGF